MSQYSTGTISLTNGSVSVSGTDTLWVTNGLDDLPPFLWLFVPEDGTFVEKVNSIGGEGALTLASPWPGPTLVDVAYRLHDGFGPAGLPIMDPGDAGTLGIVNDAMRRIETLLEEIFSFGPGEDFEFIGPASSDATAWRGVGLETGFATPSDGDIPSFDSASGEWVSTGNAFVSTDAGNDLTTNPRQWVGTQSEYDAIGSPDPNTIYNIIAS